MPEVGVTGEAERMDAGVDEARSQDAPTAPQQVGVAPSVSEPSTDTGGGAVPALGADVAGTPAPAGAATETEDRVVGSDAESETDVAIVGSEVEVQDAASAEESPLLTGVIAALAGQNDATDADVVTVPTEPETTVGGGPDVPSVENEVDGEVSGADVEADEPQVIQTEETSTSTDDGTPIGSLAARWSCIEGDGCSRAGKLDSDPLPS